VQLEGRSIVAFIDTGAQFSVISKRAAAALAITDPVLARDPAMTVLGAAAEQLDGRVHRFSQLAIGTEVIRDPEIGVTDCGLAMPISCWVSISCNRDECGCHTDRSRFSCRAVAEGGVGTELGPLLNFQIWNIKLKSGSQLARRWRENHRSPVDTLGDTDNFR